MPDRWRREDDSRLQRLERLRVRPFRSLVSRLGRRAFRRDLTSNEQERLVALLEVGRQEHDVETGVQMVIEAVRIATMKQVSEGGWLPI